MYLSALEAADGTQLGLTVLNTSSADAQVTLTARTYDGAVAAGPLVLSVNASGKLEIMLADLFGSGISNQLGWLEVAPSTPDVKAFSFVFDSALSFVEGINVTKETSDALIFPKISSRSGSVLNVVNTSSQPVSGTISLYDNAGNQVAVSLLSLAGFSGVSRSVGDLTPAVDFEGYAVVQSTPPWPFAPAVLVGFEKYRKASDFAVIRGIPASDGTSNGYWPHFGVQSGYSNRLTLINTEDTAQVVQITADGMPGTVSVTRTLLPHGKIEEEVADMFGFSGASPVTGDIRFQAQTGTPRILGALQYGTTDGKSLSAAEPQPQPLADFYFTHLAAGNGFYTGLALVNPNSGSSTVMLDLFDRSGNLKASSSLDLNPGEHKAAVIDNFFQQTINQIGGYIRVSADQPILGQELVGSSNSTDFLANVPAQTGGFPDPAPASTGLNPVPSITSLTPTQVLIDNLTSLNIRISGSGFTRGSVVNFDGVKMKTAFLSSMLLAITLQNARLTPGVHYLQVYNSTPGGGYSNVAKMLMYSGSYPTNQAPTVNAGSNQTITLPSGATLSGTVSDDGLPLSGTLISTWSEVSGAGTVTFANAASPGTTAIFPASGTYTLRLTASDGALTSSRDVTVTVNSAPVSTPTPTPTNQPPVVSAGSNQTITLPSSANLSGKATDDGLPSGTLITTWSESSGPGTITFGNINALSTTASFSTAGTYVLQLSASDTALTSTSLVTIVVNPAVTNSVSVAVAISPTSASIQTGGTQQFTAAVTGAINTAVTWSASGGTITTSGLFTAPATGGTYTVTAASQQDATKIASAAVTVAAPATAFFSTLPPGSALPSDAYCAANVTSSTWEPRTDNYTANHTTGSNVGINGMPSSINSRIDGNFTGTTNQILQWSACKWGIDEDIIRAQAVQESHWHQNAQGDYTTDATLCSNIGKTAPCYQSYGILQIKGTIRTGTYPTSQNSTAFNADWSRAYLRSCYEGYFTWLGGTYAAGDLWGCIGQYFSGSWYDAGAVDYINNVKNYYATKPWLQTGF
jgi:hypothetical protein